jgi:CBS domain-containing protein
MSELRTILEDKPDQDVAYAAPEATVHEAVGIMCKKRIGALLVARGGMVVGILSERDIMQRLVLEQRDPTKTCVAEIMTTDVLSVGLDHEPEAVMALMTERRVRHIPVMHEHAVVGVVSIGDLVRWMTRNQGLEIKVLRDYVSGVYPG